MTEPTEIKNTKLTTEETELMDEFLTDYIQKLVYEFAEMAIEKFPRMAKNEPLKIGKMAKQAAFSFVNEALDFHFEQA